MHLTVAICTWNRSAMVAQTLECMTSLHIPHGMTWELLVVENACTDDTVAAASQFLPRLPLRILHEPNPGQSHARNCAIDAASGEYIIWTDDDVVVSARWIAAYAEAFAAHRGAAVFGGPIIPRFTGHPPAWLLDHWPKVAGAFAVRDLGEHAFALDAARVPYGANFAVRSAEQKRHRYDPRLGLVQASTVRGDETAVIRAILAEGESGWWVPEARVEHVIPRERQDERYLHDWFVGEGRQSGAAIAQHAENSRRQRLFALKERVRAKARYPFTRRFASPAVWLEDLRRSGYYAGRLAELRRACGRRETRSGDSNR